MKNQGIVILPATASDLDTIAVYDSLPRHVLLSCIDNQFLLAARQEGKIIGVLRYSMFWQTIPFLEHIYIDFEMRRTGIGSLLLKYWEEKMLHSGFEYVMTSTQADETAYIFYEKAGYSKIGQFCPPRQSSPEIMYSKKLCDKNI